MTITSQSGFSVHIKTQKQSFKINLVQGAFLKSSVFKTNISVEGTGMSNRGNKAAFQISLT